MVYTCIDMYMYICGRMLQEEPCWEALRDDYMMTSQTLKDWDKHSDDSAAEEGSDAGSVSN